MRTMERIIQMVASLVAGSLLALTAGVALARAGAAPGWYYGVGLCLTALTVFRILAPTGGVHVDRFKHVHGRRGKDETHLPRPNA